MPVDSNTSSIDRRLIALLEEERGPNSAATAAYILERLDALEAEALNTHAPGSTLVVIRVAREAVQFAERIKARLSGGEPARSDQESDTAPIDSVDRSAA